MGDNDFYKPGDYNVQCDRTGFKMKRSQCRKEWNGLLVRAESWEPRHPQDFIRARADRQQVPESRNRPANYFLSDNEVKAEDL